MVKTHFEEVEKVEQVKRVLIKLVNVRFLTCGPGSLMKMVSLTGFMRRTGTV